MAFFAAVAIAVAAVVAAAVERISMIPPFAAVAAFLVCWSLHALIHHVSCVLDGARLLAGLPL